MTDSQIADANPTERDEVPDPAVGEAPVMRAPGADDAADDLHLAQAQRLDRYQVERGAGEGMIEAAAPGPEFEERA